jgi:hypothetical protein
MGSFSQRANTGVKELTHETVDHRRRGFGRTLFDNDRSGASNYFATYSKVSHGTYSVCVTNDPSSAEITNIAFGDLKNQPALVAAPANGSFRPMATETGYSAEWDAQLGTASILPGAALCGFEFSVNGRPLKGGQTVRLYTDGRTYLGTTTAMPK